MSISPSFTEPVPITRKATKLRMVVFGDPGVGKTTFALTFPKPLVVDTEGSLEGDAVLVAAGDEWSPNGYRDLDALYNWIKGTAKKGRYETLVIDSVDALVRFLLDECVDEPGKSRPPAESRGTLQDMLVPEQRDYLAVAKGMDRFLTKLRMLPMHIVLTSHVREPDPEKGQTKRVINVQPSVEKIVDEWSSIVGEMLFLRADGDPNDPDPKKRPKRVIITQPGLKTRKCKSRYAALLPAIETPTFPAMWAAIAKSEKKTGDSK